LPIYNYSEKQISCLSVITDSPYRQNEQQRVSSISKKLKKLQWKSTQVILSTGALRYLVSISLDFAAVKAISKWELHLMLTRQWVHT